MKKKNLLLLLALSCAQLSLAKDNVIVIKSSDPTHQGKTEVKVESSDAMDTLIVKPARDIETIFVTLTDAKGKVVQSYSAPVRFVDDFTIITPHLPEGYLVEIRDDKGFVYEKNNNY